MRLIAGKYGRRALIKESRLDCRPTTEKVRGAIFSTLASCRELEGTRVLDLYAGTGALGFEALSRGAEKVVFVEQHKKRVRLIRENAKLLEVDSQIHCEERSAFAFLSDFAANKLKIVIDAETLRGFDLVFADPPYDEHPGNELIWLIMSSGLLLRAAIVVIEGPVALDLHSEIASDGLSLNCFKRRNYGDTALWYYKLKQD